MRASELRRERVDKLVAAEAAYRLTGGCGALALAPFIYAVPQGLAFVGAPQAALSANQPRNPDPGAAQKIRTVFMVYTRFGR